MIGKDTRAELIGWETTTARLLSRLLQRRRHGPVFLAAIAPAPARQPALTDLDPDTGRTRLSYRRAAEVFKDASNGWTPCTSYGTPGSRTWPSRKSSSRC